jgi:CRP-like cAMP-binding protein
MDPVAFAFLFGGLSALSLPLGAAFGLWLRPSLKVTAAVMAFGAGALLCALALELVVPALAHFPNDPQKGFRWLSLGAILGSVIFIMLDQALSNMGAYLRKASTIGHKLRRVKKKRYQKILHRLSGVELLVNLPPEEVRRIISHVKQRCFSKGAVICRQGDPGDALFLIESGRVRVHSHSVKHGEEVGITVLGEGETFGEIALLTDLHRTATVEAEEDTVIWQIHRDDFDHIITVSPKLQKSLGLLVEARLNRDLSSDISPEESEDWVDKAEQNLESEIGSPTESEIINAANEHRKGGSNVALAMWLGIALDGIPESLIIGASMEGTAVSMALIGGLFLANLPESMSSAVVMKNQGGRTRSIILMWGSLMVMTAVGAAIGNLFIADMPPQTQALLEGLAAGAMLTMIAQTMLPEAFDHGGWLTGLMTVFGFLAAIYMGTLDEEKRDEALTGVHTATEISEYRGNEAVQNYSTVTDLARFRG